MKKIKILISLIIILAAGAVCTYGYFLPESIAIKQGQDSTLDFMLPLTANFSGDNVQVLKANNLPVSDNIHIDLSNTVLNGSGCGSLKMNLSLLGIPIKDVDLNVLPTDEYIPSGETVGIVIDSDGVLVLGTGGVRSKNGDYLEPCKGILRSGDLIQSVNGRKVLTKEDLISAIKLDKEHTMIKIDRLRDEVEITPVLSDDDIPMIGLWVRDSTQGIGTVTYYRKSDSSFGALGHPVTDVDTGQLMKIRGGNIYAANITGVVKGEKGRAGELSGASGTRVIGMAKKNCSAGIYGTLNQNGTALMDHAPMPIALKDHVKKGPASILADVDGKGVKEYKIEIENINSLSKNTAKGMVIKITDSELINKTGGIVQGMSGSPILQNGCLVGAVTHVFVRDPTKGYGIFIENMICEN